jgi:TonB family protein
VAPQYPELARRLKIGGTVKIEVRVAPDGKVKSTKVVGGPPLLIESAVDAVKRWKFEAAPGDTIGLVEVKFDPVPTMDARK